MKHLLMLIAVLCTGCSTVDSKRGKFYISTEKLPVITNDANYGNNMTESQKILIRGNKIQYQWQLKF